MDAGDRRYDDPNAEWRGGIAARVTAVERRLDESERAARAVAGDLVAMRIELTAMRLSVQNMEGSLRENTQERKQEQEVMLTDLKDTLRQRRLNGLQIVLALAAPVIAAVLTFIILGLITGAFGAHR